MRKRKHGQSIMLILEDGPLRCLVPIPRNDIEPGTEVITLPYKFTTARYALDCVTGGVHHYSWVGPEGLGSHYRGRPGPRAVGNHDEWWMK